MCRAIHSIDIDLLNEINGINEYKNHVACGFNPVKFYSIPEGINIAEVAKILNISEADTRYRLENTSTECREKNIKRIEAFKELEPKNIEELRRLKSLRNSK